MTLAPSHPELAPRTRRRGFGLSVAAACVLNGLAIGAFAAAVTQWHVPAGAPSQTASIDTFNVARPTPEPAAASPPTPDACDRRAEPRCRRSGPTDTPHGGRIAQGTARGRAMAAARFASTDRPRSTGRPSPTPTGTSTPRCSTLPASSAWCSRCSSATTARSSRARSSNLPRSMRRRGRRSKERLRQTVLKPAVRAGAAVASVRRIEVSAAPPGQ